MTRYRATQVSVRCSNCMSDPDRRMTFYPALDDDGSEDDLGTCICEHATDGTCQYQMCVLEAYVRWLHAKYP